MKNGKVLSQRNKRRQNNKWLLEKLKNPAIKRIFHITSANYVLFQHNGKLFTINQFDYEGMKLMFDEKIIKERVYLVTKEENYQVYEQLEIIFNEYLAEQN